ncbi:MAG: hypothetical protein QNJ78_02940 [Gammaproteobacteria bacterium]|nr:hypothetical protein [Gammaproteobacteria bacterium]
MRSAIDLPPVMEFEQHGAPSPEIPVEAKITFPYPYSSDATHKQETRM